MCGPMYTLCARVAPRCHALPNLIDKTVFAVAFAVSALAETPYPSNYKRFLDFLGVINFGEQKTHDGCGVGRDGGGGG